MYVVQLAAEGLSPFPGQTRLGFRGQLDVVHLEKSEQRSTLLDLIFCTLYPHPDDHEIFSGLVDKGGNKSRAMTTVVGRDRVTYRLLRDFSTGQCCLYRIESPNGQHESLSTSSSEIRRFLRVQLQLPDDQSYESLFVYSLDGQPSLGAHQRRRSQEGASLGPSGPGLGSRASTISRPDHPELFNPGAHALPTLQNALALNEARRADLTSTTDLIPEMTDEELLSRHQILRAEHRQTRQFARARRTLSKLDEKEQEARAMRVEMTQLHSQLNDVQKEIDSRETMRSLPNGFRDRWARHLTVIEAYQDEKKQVDQELLEARAFTSHPRPESRYYHPLMVCGVGGAIISFACIWIFQAPWLALSQGLFGTFAGGLSFWRLLQREEQTRSCAKEAYLEDRLGRIERQFLLDTAAVRGVLDRIGLSNTQGLSEQLEEYEGLVAERERLEALLDGQIGHYGRRAEAVLRRIRQRRAECEDVLDQEIDSASIEDIESHLKPLEEEIFRRRLRPLEDENDPDNLPVIKGIVDIPRLVRPASVLGGSLPHYDDDDDDGYSQGYDTSSEAETDNKNSWEGAANPPMRVSSGHEHDSYSSSVTEGYSGGVNPDSRARRVQNLCNHAADLVGIEVEPLIDRVAPRMSRYIEALTDGHFQTITFDDLANPELSGLEQNSYFALQGDRLNQVDLGIRFALLEAVLKVRRAPIFVEDPIVVVPPHRRNVLRRMYTHLASLTQLVVLTSESDLDGHHAQVETTTRL